MCNEGKAFTILDKNKQSTVYIATKHSIKSVGNVEVVLNAR